MVLEGRLPMNETMLGCWGCTELHDHLNTHAPYTHTQYSTLSALARANKHSTNQCACCTVIVTLAPSAAVCRVAPTCTPSHTALLEETPPLLLTSSVKASLCHI